MHETTQLPHPLATEHAAYLVDGRLYLPSVVLMPAAREFRARCFLSDFGIVAGFGRFGRRDSAMQQSRAVLQLISDDLPVLIEPLERGAAQAGIPIGESRQQ